VLHTANCRYLQPTANRPKTGKRLATRQELKTQDECRVCG
jgi:hypothetical protein